MTALRFSWDPAKAAENERKHGVRFMDAAKALLGDPLRLWSRTDARPHGEERTITVAHAGQHVLLVIVHTDRSGTIRIISARHATPTERRRYANRHH